MCVINHPVTDIQQVMQYHIATPVDSHGDINRGFRSLGKGMIHSCDGIPWKGRQKFNFYISRKNIKRFL